MEDNVKEVKIRACKLLHYIVTVLLFVCCLKHFYCDFTGNGLRFGTIIALYAIILLLSARTYNAFSVGLSRVRMLIYSQVLADLVAAGSFYILIVVQKGQIVNPLPLMLLVSLQFVFNCIWSYTANRVYFRYFQPANTVLIYQKESDLRRLLEVYVHDKKFCVNKVIENPSDDIALLTKEIQGFHVVFIAGLDETLRNGILKYCMEEKIRCFVAPNVGDILMMGANHMELFCVPVFRIARAVPGIEYLFVKRAFDIFCSVVGLVLLSPIMLVTAAAIKLQDKGPVIYKQRRLTKDGRVFEILKFRSMKVNAESDGVARLASEHDDRITPVGKVIRACRIDELPQLVNILKGDMSVVGPRPERPEIAKQYEEEIPEFSLRLQVRAGLTGFAQVYGRYNTEPYDKLQMDLLYINRMSLREDLKLVFSTVKVLFLKESTQGTTSEHASVRKLNKIPRAEGEWQKTAL